MTKLLRPERRLTGDTAELVASHEGQAHFAGTGPANKTCRECRFWCFVSREKGMWGTLKPGPCEKFIELTGRPGPAVPHDAGACRYFEQSAEPPSASRSGS